MFLNILGKERDLKCQICQTYLYWITRLIQHKISRLRDENTGTNEFRKLIEEIAMLMGYEATP